MTFLFAGAVSVLSQNAELKKIVDIDFKYHLWREEEKRQKSEISAF